MTNYKKDSMTKYSRKKMKDYLRQNNIIVEVIRDRVKIEKL